MFKDLPQYHFERDDFCKAFELNATDAELCEMLSSYHFITSSFLFQRVDDEFYIIHLNSGIMINWYKHLGRTNTCNRRDFKYTDLLTFLKMFMEEWRDEIHKEVKEGFKLTKTSDVPDVNSLYPDILKIAINSTYGTCIPHTKINKDIINILKETKEKGNIK